MKVIIAGGRDFDDYSQFVVGLDSAGFDITEVVSGGAAGADRMGEIWADFTKTLLTRFPADWVTHGKAAGPIRNQQMVDYADALIAFWDGTSRGTRDIIQRARKKGIPLFIYRYLS